MRKMTSNEIRTLWIKYFEEHGHKYVESAPLIPRDDNSLLWINAGVTPLKKYFDGTVIPESRRIVNIQKCIRTNDIENVSNNVYVLSSFEPYRLKLYAPVFVLKPVYVSPFNLNACGLYILLVTAPGFTAEL